MTLYFITISGMRASPSRWTSFSIFDVLVDYSNSTDGNIRLNASPLSTPSTVNL
jgi:hypothetical protein